MTLAQAAEQAEKLRPGGLTRTAAVRLLSQLDGIIAAMTAPRDKFSGYGDDAPDDTVLFVPYPFDGIYTDYLIMMTDLRESETQLYTLTHEIFENDLALYLSHAACSGAGGDTRIRL